MVFLFWSQITFQSRNFEFPANNSKQSIQIFAQGSDLAPFTGNGTKVKIPSENKSHLAAVVKAKLMSKFNILIWLNIAHAKCWHDQFFGSFIQVSKIDKGLRLERNLSRLKLLSHITLVAVHKLCCLGRGGGKNRQFYLDKRWQGGRKWVKKHRLWNGIVYGRPPSLL